MSKPKKAKKARPTYTEEFKASAVDLLRTSGKPAAQLARELGCSIGSLSKWKNDFLGTSAAGTFGAVGGNGAGEASAEEIWNENVRLRKEVLHLQRQRDILKKAASILAEDPQLGMR